jgi:hypothetical protein
MGEEIQGLDPGLLKLGKVQGLDPGLLMTVNTNSGEVATHENGKDDCSAVSLKSLYLMITELNSLKYVYTILCRSPNKSRSACFLGTVNIVLVICSLYWYWTKFHQEERPRVVHLGTLADKNYIFCLKLRVG